MVPPQFNIFINDTVDGTKCTLSKLAGDTKLGEGADLPDGCAAIQRDLDRMQKYTDGSLMKFKKRKMSSRAPGKREPQAPVDVRG